MLDKYHDMMKEGSKVSDAYAAAYSSKECSGGHRYFVATDGAVEQTGMVFVIAICTACGEAKKFEFRVSDGQCGLSLSDSNKINKT